MKKAVSKMMPFVGAAVLSGLLILNAGTITAYANVPPEAEQQDASEDPPEPVDNNGTAPGDGSGDPLTPDGNGTEVDSVDDNGKYFYTIKTDAGN